ncbi:DUF1569 domain-containing protein [Hymenobacter sp. BT770]|uniref:DUF1569 domain-containing protein n=1 Tax=Hymenobacter sp. BT770 TaxID=2886942 RepID=UPI001D106FDF|nr:DUF1569 domain-containing protein [Hymenobacter sp. BT770]MCC3153212.1 DUF1569 domain-containing protein [Hymenobacter sp. BT770]MDO3415314.1 DUF1569 domain-containing protein [Hymenobacter sp. BT770]
MKTIFDKPTQKELIDRMHGLHEDSSAQWGRMNAYQMLKHCALAHEMILQNQTHPRALMGRLLGRILLKNEVKDDRPMRRGNPTIPALQVNETTGDFAAEKSRWVGLVHDYAQYSFPDHSFVHPFFGKMTREQIGYHAYKHTDHHLRQFGC